jgi:hypothetical protein
MNLPHPVMHPLLRAWPVTARDALPLALWSAAEIAAACCGTASHDFEASGVEMDSRDVKPGDLFVALKGEAMDCISCRAAARASSLEASRAARPCCARALQYTQAVSFCSWADMAPTASCTRAQRCALPEAERRAARTPQARVSSDHGVGSCEARWCSKARRYQPAASGCSLSAACLPTTPQAAAFRLAGRAAAQGCPSSLAAAWRISAATDSSGRSRIRPQPERSPNASSIEYSSTSGV